MNNLHGLAANGKLTGTIILWEGTNVKKEDILTGERGTLIVPDYGEDASPIIIG